MRVKTWGLNKSLEQNRKQREFWILDLLWHFRQKGKKQTVIQNKTEDAFFIQSPLRSKCLKYSESPIAPVTITLTLLVCQIRFSLSLNMDVLKTFSQHEDIPKLGFCIGHSALATACLYLPANLDWCYPPDAFSHFACNTSPVQINK